MNFLAHLYLTKNQAEELILGNFIADAVKGKISSSPYNATVKLGMEIHREIDYFTDKHKIVQKGCKRLYPNYGKFAGIIIDIFYDHILAINWDQYSDLSLPQFAEQQYQIIQKQEKLLPQKTSYWFQYMLQQNILVAYASEDRIEEVLKGMDRRTRHISGMSTAIQELRAYKSAYEQEFFQFFEEIQTHLHSKFPSLRAD
jgi:acyl carrier protein phosphodiesterase